MTPVAEMIAQTAKGGRETRDAAPSAPAGAASLSVIADIGGTNARFALVGEAGNRRPWSHEEKIPVAAFPSPGAAFAAWWHRVSADLPAGTRLRHGAFSVACPIQGDLAAFTNSPWRFSIEETRKELGLDSLQVMNDFAANALAVPALQPTDMVAVGAPSSLVAGFPVAVVGPGTGLGVSLAIPLPAGGVLPVSTEGGHVTLAACDGAEAAVIEAARQKFGHVSAERLVCGSGLAELYQLLAPHRPPLSPVEISAAALGGGDEVARQAIDLFCAFLGTTAGNLALSCGARGGVVLTGGILPAILPLVQAGPFRRRFEEKGRFTAYLRDVATLVVTHPYPAFLGLREALPR